GRDEGDEGDAAAGASAGEVTGPGGAEAAARDEGDDEGDDEGGVTGDFALFDDDGEVTGDDFALLDDDAAAVDARETCAGLATRGASREGRDGPLCGGSCIAVLSSVRDSSRDSATDVLVVEAIPAAFCPSAAPEGVCACTVSDEAAPEG